MGGRKMEWAAQPNHLGGAPRKVAVAAAAAFAKVVVNLLNTTTVHNGDTLLRLVKSRPPGVPLITVSNHMSTLDDPLMWGFKGFPTSDAKLTRWVLAAEDICFKNTVLSYFFRVVTEYESKGVHAEEWGSGEATLWRGYNLSTDPMMDPKDVKILDNLKNVEAGILVVGEKESLFVISAKESHVEEDKSNKTAGKCIPITRGGGIYQEHMNEALDRLSEGEWLHTFPEGKVSQEDLPTRRLKWGTASLIARAPVTPIVLPIVHHGFEKVMPENYMFGSRPPFPLCNRNIKIIIGEPVKFDIPKLKELALSTSRKSSLPSDQWPNTSPDGLDVAAQRYLYTTISEKIRSVMESLRSLGKIHLKSRA
ncbi:hypothetical protein RJ639_042261 [Escallonia herrerae]|uniref:Tafazzin family protein n=1 Tax=Escallonia herrerae TaxID=1293975 RepID=A0AA89B4L5_9ASTE|nr:hypothetical protein RJ639_042261 [Escallonia herrerae]